MAKTYKLKIYPSYGDSPQDGHSFGYFGSDVWAEDVFEFLNDVVVPRIYLVQNFRIRFKFFWNQVGNEALPVWFITGKKFLSTSSNPHKHIIRARVHGVHCNRTGGTNSQLPVNSVTGKVDSGSMHLSGYAISREIQRPCARILAMNCRFVMVRALFLLASLQFGVSAQTDRSAVVDFCQVVTSPAKYDKQVVSIEGILSPGEHSTIFYNASCIPKEGFDTRILPVLPPDWSSSPNGKKLAKIFSNRKDARVTLSGRFEGSGGPYGPDVAPFRFSVSEIMSVEKSPKAVSRKQPKSR
jgi:hypothetical protein